MTNIIKELKKKRESAKAIEKPIDEEAKQLQYEEIYSKEDIKDVESFIKDMEDLGGEVTVEENDITVIIPLDLKESLKEVEAKHFDTDESAGVSTGFKDVITISGNRDELVAIAKKCGLDIKDIKLNKIAEKSVKSGNIFGIEEGVHLVAISKDKKNAGKLLLVIDKDIYNPDKDDTDEDVKEEKLDSKSTFKILKSWFEGKQLEKYFKVISKDPKSVKALEKAIKKSGISLNDLSEIEDNGNKILDNLDDGEAIEFIKQDLYYVADILDELVSEGVKLNSELIKKVSIKVYKTPRKELSEEKIIAYFLGKKKDVNEEDADNKEYFEIDIPIANLVDEDGEEIDPNEVIKVIKSCEGVNEAEALEDHIRVKYDESCEDELINKLEECGIEIDIEDED